MVFGLYKKFFFKKNKYYKYRITHSQTIIYDVCDIWSFAASPDSVASQIIDINDQSYRIEPNYVNPFGSNDHQRRYFESIIYEIHIYNWGKAVNGRGKFTDIENEVIRNHLKDLGVTHVQLLPSFDYAQTNSDPKYNWGFTPYNFNVPEGRYVDNMTDGIDAIVQF